MKKGQEIAVGGMGFMGLETYYSKVKEIINEEWVLVDFGEPDVCTVGLQKIHKSRIESS
jgi:hypothetical protein